MNTHYTRMAAFLLGTGVGLAPIAWARLCEVSNTEDGDFVFRISSLPTETSDLSPPLDWPSHIIGDFPSEKEESGDVLLRTPDEILAFRLVKR